MRKKKSEKRNRKKETEDQMTEIYDTVKEKTDEESQKE